MRRPGWAWVLALAVTGCLSVYVCTLGSARPIFKVGLVAPFEGRYRALGYEVLHAVRLAVQEWNDAGGAAGYGVELVALDDGAYAVSSALRARELVSDPAVLGVVGPFSEATVKVAAPFYADAGLAMITPSICPPLPAEVDYGTGPYCLGASASALGQALVSRVPPNRQAALLHSRDSTLGCRLSETIEVIVGPPWREETFSQSVDSPFVYLYDGGALDGAELVRRVRRVSPLVPVWGGPALARTQLPQIAGEAAAGVCYAITAPPFADLSPQSSFAAAYQTVSGAVPGPWAALAYDATRLLLDAIEAQIQETGIPTRAGIVERLAQLRARTEPVFSNGWRRDPDVAFYCYTGVESYPGRLLDSYSSRAEE